MKILDFLNVSNISNLEADSGFVFQRILTKEILKQRPSWEIYFISPENPLPEEPRLHHIPLDYGHSKFEARFNFPWFELKEKLTPVISNIDLIYINQSEQTANFRALAGSLQPDKSIPIVSYVHYFPIDPGLNSFNGSMIKPSSNGRLHFDSTLNTQNLGSIVLMRQIEALSLSSYGITCSNFGINLIDSSIKKLFPDFSAKYEAINPPICLNEASQGQNVKKDDRNTIVYNHRLYDHYGPNEFFEYLDWYYDNRRKDFRVIITDPTSGRSAERNTLDKSVGNNKSSILKRKYVDLIHSVEREEYYKTIGRCKIGIAPFKPSALWSMSLVDCMASGTPVIVPNYACFPEMVEKKSGLVITNKNELADTMDRMFDDSSFYQQARDYCIERSKNYSVENTAAKFIKFLRGLNNDRKC
ncbi:MAG: glycosyltransferase [Candidatus Pacearchaeota archaeon]|jgi:glycosyltransferase involved in cell wall biosynthesis